MDKVILVVDDHPLYRMALEGLVEQSGRARVVPAGSAAEGLQKLHHRHPDLVLLDLNLPGIAGADAVTLFRRACSAPVVVVSATERRQEVAAALRAGACAAVSKMATLDTLRRVIASALDATLEHGQWFRETRQLRVDDEGHDFTPRQHEIAALLLSGHSNKEIGIRLGLAEITVKTHLTALFRRLGVANRIQAAMAIRMLGVEPQQGNHASHA